MLITTVVFRDQRLMGQLGSCKPEPAHQTPMFLAAQEPGEFGTPRSAERRFVEANDKTAQPPFQSRDAGGDTGRRPIAG
jgi:hypothetical protein